MNAIIFWGACGLALAFLLFRKQRHGGQPSRTASTRGNEPPPAPQPKKKVKVQTRRVKVTLTAAQWAMLRTPGAKTLEEKCSLILAARADALTRQYEASLTREG